MKNFRQQSIFENKNPTNFILYTILKISFFFLIVFLGSFNKQYAVGDSPIDALQQAISCFATAIKFKPKDATFHLQLAMVLEEKYYAEDMFGLKREVRHFVFIMVQFNSYHYIFFLKIT